MGVVGFLPIAPGTWGTLAAVVFIWFVNVQGASLLILTVLVFILGVISAEVAEGEFKRKDSSHIVIDEVCGYFVSLLFLPKTYLTVIMAFFLFRFFDILKPPPVRHFERIKGGLGVMLDDVFAGVYANIVIQVTLIYLPWK